MQHGDQPNPYRNWSHGQSQPSHYPGPYTPPPYTNPHPYYDDFTHRRRAVYPPPPVKQPSGLKGFLLHPVSVPVWVLLLCGLLIIGGGEVAGEAMVHYTRHTQDTVDTGTSSQPVAPTPTLPPTPTPTPAPTHTPTWTTTYTFQGNGDKKTTPFTVPDTWRLVWSCDPAAYGDSYNVMVDVVGADGSYVDPGAVNTICQTGNTGGSTMEYQGGSVYLDVGSEAGWIIKVQVLK
jgi:hypothetical protein